MKVQDDILLMLDGRKGAALLHLDPSAAFDTIDHTILLETLRHEDGITGECLKWMECYLQERRQTVFMSGHHSQRTPLKCGVPQGSVLGPFLFSYLKTLKATACPELLTPSSASKTWRLHT